MTDLAEDKQRHWPECSSRTSAWCDCKGLPRAVGSLLRPDFKPHRRIVLGGYVYVLEEAA